MTNPDEATSNPNWTKILHGPQKILSQQAFLSAHSHLSSHALGDHMADTSTKPTPETSKCTRDPDREKIADDGESDSARRLQRDRLASKPQSSSKKKTSASLSHCYRSTAG
mmetsp:Transcript_24195/g.78847  ORF Transcript_24195/g.78847 Transcript_24195/m.78847 type:complete len:111 (-) Transcript_24195:378-710(-)